MGSTPLSPHVSLPLHNAAGTLLAPTSISTERDHEAGADPIKPLRLRQAFVKTDDGSAAPELYGDVPMCRLPPKRSVQTGLRHSAASAIIRFGAACRRTQTLLPAR